MPADSLRMPRPVEGALLLVVLLLAAYLRMGQPGITEFKRDEANLSLLALDFATGGELPLLGIGSSVGFPNAPANVILLALPYALDHSPLLATRFISLLNVIAVGLVYVLARRYTGPVPALFAALLMAANPWGVAFSRKIWAQNMLPPFVLLSLLAGLAGFVDGRRWGQWVFAPLLVITGQIHYGAFVIVPAMLMLPVQGRRHLTRAFWGGVVVAVLLVLPFALGLHRADLLSPASWSDALATDEPTTVSGGALLTTEALRGAAVLVAGTEIHAFAGPERFMEFLVTVPEVYPLFNPLAGLLVLAAIWLLYRALRLPDARTPIDVALLLLVVFPIAAFSVTWTPFFIHYLIPILPVAFLVMALALHDLLTWLVYRTNLRRVLVLSLGSYVIAIAGLQVVLSLALLDFVREHATPGGFGTPLGELLAVREALFDLEPEQVIGDLDGESVNFGGEDVVWQALLYDVPQVRFEGPDVMVLPAQPAVMLVAGCPSDNEAGTVYRLRPGEGCYQIVEREPDNPPLEGFTSVGPPNRFASGVVIEGFRWETGAANCLSLLWRIHTDEQRDVQFAVHGFDHAGERVAVRDGLSWPGRYWQPGDRVIRQFCFGETGESLARIDIGMYVLTAGGGFSNYDLLDANGVPAGQMLPLPLPDAS